MEENKKLKAAIEILKKGIDYAKFTENSIVTLDIDYAERLLLKLTEQYESPTLEEVKKEWEKLGYEFSFKNENNLLDIVNLEELSVIKIDIKGRKYIKVNCVNYSGFVPLTYEEHILLTKIFIALGWL